MSARTARRAKALATLEPRTRAAWRRWLERHHDDKREIWLVFYKVHTAKTTIAYEEALEEAICFGWVDSLVRRLDEARYARKFTPRTTASRWSALNKRRYASLEARGLLAPAGLAKPPSGPTAAAPGRREWPLPAYMERALRARPVAWRRFGELAPSERRAYIGWVDSAKRAETRERRLREAVGRLARGEKLGLK